MGGEDRGRDRKGEEQGGKGKGRVRARKFFTNISPCPHVRILPYALVEYLLNGHILQYSA